MQSNHPDLRDAVNQLYRQGASIGDGGTAAAIRQEIASGGVLQHLQKGVDRMGQLTNILRGGGLSSKEYDIAVKLLRDLESAVPKEFWKHTYINW